MAQTSATLVVVPQAIAHKAMGGTIAVAMDREAAVELDILAHQEEVVHHTSHIMGTQATKAAMGEEDHPVIQEVILHHHHQILHPVIPLHRHLHQGRNSV